MKPTVSVSKHLAGRPGRASWRVVGSSVAKSLFSAVTRRRRQRIEERGLAGVGVADDRHDRNGCALALASLQRRAAGGRPPGSRRTSAMRERMRRRSISNLVSPGPRTPIAPPTPPPPEPREPPPRRERSLPRPVSRGRRYSSCASSTCKLALAGARVLGEDIEDQRRAVDDAQIGQTLRGCAAASAKARRRRSAGRDPARRVAPPVHARGHVRHRARSLAERAAARRFRRPLRPLCAPAPPVRRASHERPTGVSALDFDRDQKRALRALFVLE